MMKIQPATLNVIDKIISLIVKDQKTVVDAIKLKAYLSENISKDMTELFIAIDEQTQQVIGMIQAFKSYSTIGRSQYRFISEIYIDPQMQQSTIIKELLNALELIAIQNNNSHFDVQIKINDTALQQALLDKGFYKDDGYMTFVKDLTTIYDGARSKTITSDTKLAYTIRKAITSDINNLIALINHYLEFYHITFDENKDKAFLFTNLDDKRSDIFIAIDKDNQILGFTQLYRCRNQEYLGDYYILFDLFVSSNVRKNGIASELLESAERFAFQQGAKFIELQTALANKAAQQLYRKHGYNEKQIISFVKNLPKNGVNNSTLCNTFLVLDATLSQQQIWHDVAVTPNTLKYNMSWCWKMTGHVSIDEITNAWKKLIILFPSLHTYFRYQDNKLYQIINSTIVPKCDVKEVGDINEDQIMILINNYTHHHFDLKHAPLCKAYLFITKHNTFYLGFTFHHMVLDGHSIPIIMKKFCESYQNPLANIEASNTINITLLTRFLVQEKQQIASSKYIEAKVFWQNYLKNIPMKINFPMTSQSTNQKNQRRNLSFSISTELKGQINTFVVRNNITLFIFMSAVFSILLSQYSQQQKFTIGYPFGRRTKEFVDLVGYHVNLLPLAIDFTANKTFISLLNSIKQHRTEIKQNGLDHYPYVEMVKDLRILPLNNTALFNAIISPTRFASLSISGIQFNELSLDSAENLTDLMLFYDENQTQSIECGIEFNTQIFGEETLQKFINDFKLLVSQLTNHLDQSIDLLLPHNPNINKTQFTNV